MILYFSAKSGNLKLFYKRALVCLRDVCRIIGRASGDTLVYDGMVPRESILALSIQKGQGGSPPL